MSLFRRLFFGIGLVALGAAGMDAIAAANVTPETSVDEVVLSVGVRDLAPAECGTLALDTLIVGSGTVNGTSGNDLLIGGSGDDVLDGKSGDDCIVAGAGNDTIDGGSGADVLLGGGGDDALDGGAHTDVCRGGGQSGDTFSKCETQGP
ncbi:MAG: hypothetical protein R3C39_10635 [Dehalococcoidia bacterium]